MNIHDANLKRNGNWSYRSSTSEIILHHAEASRASVEDVNSWHIERGWAGIGYHYYVRKDGTIWRGRPEWAVGAHAVGHNDRSIGICCEGAYMTETMPAAQLSALKGLICDIMSRYGNLELLRHKDVNSTDCPGVNFPWAEVQKYAQSDAKKEDGEVVEKGSVEEIFNNPKSQVAKELILTDGSQQTDLKPVIQSGDRVRIVFSENSAFEPVIANMILKFHEPVNILKADTKNVGGVAKGEMILEFPGDSEKAEAMKQYLKERGLAIGEVTDSVD